MRPAELAQLQEIRRRSPQSRLPCVARPRPWGSRQDSEYMNMNLKKYHGFYFLCMMVVTVFFCLLPLSALSYHQTSPLRMALF